MNNKTMINFALITSSYAILFLLRGMCIAFTQWLNRHENSKQEKNRIATVRVNNDFMDHSLLTYIMLALAAAFDINAELFLAVLIYFLLMKMTEAFGFLSSTRDYPIFIRNTGSLITLMPLLGLSLFVFIRSIQQII